MYMATTGTPFISEGMSTFILAISNVLFTAMIIWMTIRDYRLYLDEHWKEKYSFSSFIKREQFFFYMLLLFIFLVTLALWLPDVR